MEQDGGLFYLSSFFALLIELLVFIFPTYLITLFPNKVCCMNQNYALACFQINDSGGEMVCKANKAFIFVFLLFYCSSLVYAQSALVVLDKELNNASDANKTEILLQLIDHSRNSAPKQALAYGQQALVLLEVFPNDKNKIKVLNQMCWVWRLLNEYDKAFTSGKEAEKLAILTNDLQGQSLALNNIGVIYWSLGDYNQVLDYWSRALSIREKIGDENGIAGSLNNIGQVYFHLNDNKSATHYYEQALEISKRTGNREYLVNHLDNLGEVYLKLKHFSKAETVLLQAQKIAKEDVNNKGFVSTLINLGQLNLLKNKQDVAQSMFLQAENIAEQMGMNAKAIEARQQLALIAYQSKEYDQALMLAQKSLIEAERITDKQLIIDSYKLLVDIQESTKDYRASLDAFKQYKYFSEQMLNQKKQNQITSIQIQLETEQKEKQIALLEAESQLRDIKLQSVERIKYNLLIVIAVLSIFSLILVWGYREKSKANKTIRIQNRELEQTRQELHLLAITDPLTKLFNRRAINKQLDSELVKVSQTPIKLCLCIMDLDNFKQVNDTNGHDFGDYVLVEIARILNEEIRDSDTVGRWGGEEFFILLADTDSDDALVILNRLLNKISTHTFRLNAISKQITATIGFSLYQKSTLLKDVIKAADDALYEGKKAGRNQVVFKDVR